jgi:hypothetical protein
MSQSLPALERYHKATEAILNVIDIMRMYSVARRQKALSQSLEQQITSLLEGLPKNLELVESLPQSDALVVQYGSGVYSICGVHGASVHAAVITLARRLSGSLSVWKWLVNRRDASTELDRAKAALKHEIGKVKKQLIPPTAKRGQAEGKGGKKRRGAPTKKETKQRADYAKPLVDKGLTWPEIFERYAKTAKGKADKEANADAMRLAFGREYPAR